MTTVGGTYEMNLIRSDIVKIFSITEVTDEWECFMRNESNPDYIAKEKMYKVQCLEDCYGVQSLRNHTWSESTLNEIKKRGWYVG